LQSLFLAAVKAEEQGRKSVAMETYSLILAIEPAYTAALINLGTLHYHQKQYDRAEELYRRATISDPSYVLAFFDLGNVLDELERPDESIAAYRRAIALAPGYADAHYNLALAYERKGERRRALAHWQIYVRLDKSGPWADHARGQIRKLLSREKLSIAHRAYHALFYTHFYLAPTEADFVPWPMHRAGYNFLGAAPGAPNDRPKVDKPYQPPELLDYALFCHSEVSRQMASVDFDAPSGFYWLPFSKFELQLYTLRHLAHHTGQLADRLRALARVGVPWVR
jgi:tetratricopeptide (TPR) repeat protein